MPKQVNKYKLPQEHTIWPDTKEHTRATASSSILHLIHSTILLPKNSRSSPTPYWSKMHWCQTFARSTPFQVFLKQFSWHLQPTGTVSVRVPIQVLCPNDSSRQSVAPWVNLPQITARLLESPTCQCLGYNTSGAPLGEHNICSEKLSAQC